ncbi:pyridoxal phosphate (PLP)-dependent transferases superfamily protein [Artemisia annua]|uniref:Pyridoxal phosphate (PLP)-dependent transferases superfamily protein n=1 Tax=Artemisia annua TaxID=35608 RepID=A0A2U1M7N7_ARTAN|nr:pyridoxal phosphate (PLP)-dependent transferases superfamily protein [Artemisia annua]
MSSTSFRNVKDHPKINFTSLMQFNRTRSMKLHASKNATTSPEQEPAYKTKVSRNGNMAKLQAGYLFPEVCAVTFARLVGGRLLICWKYPDAHVISLGIGNTTEPISEVITSAMAKRALELSTVEGYNVDGAEKGEKKLRGLLASIFYANLGIEEDDLYLMVQNLIFLDFRFCLVLMLQWRRSISKAVTRF